MHVYRVYGIVQGVGFRPYVWRLATSLRLVGCVKNKGSYVEILFDGAPSDVAGFMDRFPADIPPNARIDRIDHEEVPGDAGTMFSIAPSDSSSSSYPSGIPPDLAICDACRKDLLSPSNRRHRYPFTNCTDCGPRFTIISGTPYDRSYTTMSVFSMCPSCRGEYESPADRRYHAEPIACGACGPEYTLSEGGSALSGEEAIRETAALLNAGSPVAIKGYGGFHLACNACDDRAVLRLRRLLGRPFQPFALMARDLASARKDLDIGSGEATLLTSPMAPIVVVPRAGGCTLPEAIAPGLDTLGVMLPYAPLHELLFSELPTPFLVMTSANFPGNPMILSSGDVLRHLPGIPAILDHNLVIKNRCDDSVIRDGKFIRRSRGVVPGSLTIPSRSCFAALGAELNNVMAVSSQGECMPTQHIGDTSNWDALEFGLSALSHVIRLKGLTRDALEFLCCDLHPSYNTSIIAQEWASELSIPLYRIQHHEAHAFAICGEYGLEEALCIAADGLGYGVDGNTWGGEVLHATCVPSETKRLGHQEYLLMPGGDAATSHPLRIVLPLLESDGLRRLAPLFEGGMEEIEAIRAGALAMPYRSSSCGRVLDAASALLGLSLQRTYEGEGAMRLESCATGGSDLFIPIETEGGSILTGDLIRRFAALVGRESPRDLAMSVHCSLARGYLELLSECEDLHIPVGFSGGVAINAILSKKLKCGVEGRGLRFLEHRLVPPGDGGISYGQSCLRHY